MASTSPVTVLVYESQQPLMRLLRWALAEERFTVVASDDPAEAAAILRAGGVRAVLVNVAATPEELRALIADLRAAAPTPIIALLPEGAADPGADVTIPPPYRGEDIHAAIDRAAAEL